MNEPEDKSSRRKTGGSRRDFLRAAALLLVSGASSNVVAATTARALKPKAGLFLIGGPSRDHLAEPDLDRELIRRSKHAGGSTVSFVTSASVTFTEKRMKERLASLVKAGIDPKNIHFISIMKADERPEVIRDTPFAITSDDRKGLETAFGFLQKDDIVFLDGGDQKRLVPVMQSAKLDAHGLSAWDYISRRYLEEDGFLLAGTSAGSAAMPRRMIHADTVNLPEPAQYWGFNLPGLDGISIDTHYDRRGRIWRFPNFMKKVGDRIGVGLPENGGIFLADGVAEAFSVGTVEHLTAVQFHRAGTEVEKKFRHGERFALTDLRAEAMAG